jgi:serine phosphatase RsbU (regulator of sigma subunit)
MPDPKPPKRSSKLKDLLRLLWMQPLAAIPFALFFGTLFGSGWSSYWGAYLISLVFAYTIGITIWATEAFLRPRLLPDDAVVKGSMWKHGLLFGGMSLFGSLVAATIIHFTLMPGFMGSARQVTTILLFAVLFVVLVSGIVYATHFYRDAINQARSEQELNLARRIQRSFLLSEFPAMPRLEVYATNVSSKQVSGDFYDLIPAGHDAFYLAVADVSGKGVPAALLTSMLQASIRTQAAIAPPVSAMMRNVNALVNDRSVTGQFATFFLARVDEAKLEMTFTNAGHNFPVVFGADGELRTLERGGTIVGVLPDVAYEEETIALKPGDRVVFYTDGITEAADAKNELFGEDRLYAAVAALPADLGARAVTEGILAAVRAFLDGVEPNDDMTVVVLRVLEPSAARVDGAGSAAPAAALPHA